MTKIAFNSPRRQWLFTPISLVILFLTGVIVSLLVTSDPFPTNKLDLRAWMGWRLLFYALLIGLWPLLIRYVLVFRRVKSSKTPTRQRVVVLIVLYEVLIVQNPLQVLLNLGSV